VGRATRIWIAVGALIVPGLAALSDYNPMVPVGPGLVIEGEPPTPCEQVVDGCHVPRLENVVLRGDQEDGALGAIDGMDASKVIGFDEALAAARENNFPSDAETVQVVLGAADAEELRWGTGGKRLYYAVQWGGVKLPCFGPAACRPDQFGTWSTVIEATTGRYIVSGS